MPVLPGTTGPRSPSPSTAPPVTAASQHPHTPATAASPAVTPLSRRCEQACGRCVSSPACKTRATRPCGAGASAAPDYTPPQRRPRMCGQARLRLRHQPNQNRDQDKDKDQTQGASAPRGGARRDSETTAEGCRCQLRAVARPAQYLSQLRRRRVGSLGALDTTSRSDGERGPGDHMPHGIARSRSGNGQAPARSRSPQVTWAHA